MDSSVWTALSGSSVGPVWWQLETSLGRGLSPGVGAAEPHVGWGGGVEMLASTHTCSILSGPWLWIQGDCCTGLSSPPAESPRSSSLSATSVSLGPMGHRMSPFVSSEPQEIQRGCLRPIWRHFFQFHIMWTMANYYSYALPRPTGPVSSWVP